MRIFGVITLAGLLLLLGIQIRSSLSRQNQLNQEFQELQTKFQKAQLDYGQLKADYDFYSDPENLEKELRARFNYRQPGEKLIIIVPEEQSSSSIP